MFDPTLQPSSELVAEPPTFCETTIPPPKVSDTARDRYRTFCAAEPSVPIFSQAWWLDIVCGKDGWDACLVEKGGQIVGALPFRLTRRLLFDVIHMPPLTQNFKVWIRYTSSKKSESRLSHEKEVISELIEKLPRFDYFHLKLHHTLTNWLPFYWKGFTQTTLYTYVIDDLTDIEQACSRFSHAKRKNLKRAESEVTLGPELSAEAFHLHHTRTLAESGEQISYSRELFAQIHEACYSRGSGKVFTAVDASNQIHAAIFVVWDSEQAYYLISSIDPAYKASGAVTYLIKKALTHLQGKTTCFDFEGSMIEGVENSFRQFGTIQKPYCSIRKIPSSLLKFRQFLQDFSRRAA